MIMKKQRNAAKSGSQLQKSRRTGRALKSSTMYVASFFFILKIVWQIVYYVWNFSEVNQDVFSKSSKPNPHVDVLGARVADRLILLFNFFGFSSFNLLSLSESQWAPVDLQIQRSAYK